MTSRPGRLSAALSLSLALGCANDLESAAREPSSSALPEVQKPSAAIGAKPTVADPEYLCGQRELPPDVLLDVGHDGEARLLGVSESRVLAAGSDGDDRWILWDVHTRRQVASGHFPGEHPWLLGDLAGDVVLVGSIEHGIQLLDARDGSVLNPSLTTGPGWEAAGLATDASYAWATGPDGVTSVLSLDGRVLARHAALDRYGVVSAQPKRLQLADPDTITTIDLTNGTKTVSDMFEGAFDGWFPDGSHFVTRASGRLRVYTRDAKLVKTSNLPNLASAGGYGQFVWTLSGGLLEVYRLSEERPVLSFQARPARPIASDEARASGSSVAILDHGAGSLQRIELGGDAPKVEQRTFPAYLSDSFTSDHDGHWAATGDGIVFGVRSDGVAALGCGFVYQVVGSPTGTVAVATSDAKVRIYDLRSESKRPIATLPFGDSALMFSQDGRKLLVQNTEAGKRTVYVMAWPEGTVLNAFHEDRPSSRLLGTTLSGNGERVARLICTESGTCTVEVTNIDGTPVYRTPALPEITDGPRIRLSPSGDRLAVAASWNTILSFERGAQMGSIVGLYPTWIDEDRLLITQRVAREPSSTSAGTLTSNTRPLTSKIGIAGRIVDPHGRELLALESSRDWLETGVADAQHVVRSGLFSAIYRTSDGKRVWEGRPGARYVTTVGDYAVEGVNDAVVVSRWR